MSLSDLASLGSFIGGIAVVFSFLFLGLQIRQADKSQKALLVCETSNLINDWFLKLIEPQYADLQRRMIAGDTAFTDTEVIQLMNMLSVVLNTMEAVHIERELSLVDVGTANAAHDLMVELFSGKVPRALWPMVRSQSSPGFRAQIDDIIRTTPIAQGTSPSTRLQANLAKIA